MLVTIVIGVRGRLCASAVSNRLASLNMCRRGIAGREGFVGGLVNAVTTAARRIARPVGPALRVWSKFSGCVSPSEKAAE
jgi:hypothetical protein